jgi:hypothetical protein
MPLFIAFSNKLIFFVTLVYITNILFYYELLVIVLKDIKYYKFSSITTLEKKMAMTCQ